METAGQGSVLFYRIPDLQGLELAQGFAADSLVRRKELIYVGSFRKEIKGQPPQSFSVDDNLLRHWDATFLRMSAAGVAVPVPKEHTTDPEARRGTLIKTEIAANAKGLPALFGYIEFASKEALEACKNADVSVFVPEDYTDGKGNKYVRPISHVALTDYPVIPGLGKFEPLAASLSQGIEKVTIDARKLATKLGIAAEVKDAELETAIAGAVDALADKVQKLSAAPEVPAPAVPAKKEEEKPAAPVVVSASLVNVVKENREMKIAALVNAGKLSPAAAAEMKTEYCSEPALQLSFAPGAKDGFAAAIRIAEKNEPSIAFKERTRGQSERAVLSLSQQTGSENPVVKNAEARAAAAKAN